MTRIHQVLVAQLKHSPGKRQVMIAIDGQEVFFDDCAEINIVNDSEVSFQAETESKSCRFTFNVRMKDSEDWG